MTGYWLFLASMRRASRSSLPPFVSRQVSAARRYFLDLRPDRRRPLVVVCGGEERVRADYVVARDDFPYCCVEFVAAGRGHLTLAGRTEALGPGSVFSYGPGFGHEIRTARRQRLRKYYVDFVGTEALGRLRAARLEPGRHLAVSRPHEIGGVFDLLQQCGLAQSAHSQALCTQLLGVLLTKISESAVPPGSAAEAGYGTFSRFRQFLTHGRERLLSVEQGAREFGITPAYACRLFRRHGERSPYQFLLAQRMALAADLLAHDGLQVRQAAARLGFPDVSQFSRAFKRVAGVSPRAFRRRA